MIVAIIFAHVWGVMQLAALGSLARTTRLRTLSAAMAAGFYACAAASLLIQVFLTRLAAWVSGASVDAVVRVASYTIDPFVEEIVKLLPVAGLLTRTVVKRQWSLTDCVLVGAATGSGFGLAEDFFRYGGNAARAISVPGGWLAQLSLALPTVPTPWNAVTSWLPAGAAVKGLLSSSSTWALNVHLVWSAIGGLAAGLMLLRRSTLDVWVGAALLFYVCGDHAAFNAHGASGWSLAGVLAAPFNVLRPLLWGLPIVALAVAWRLDRRLLASRESAHLLSAEQASPSRAGGTFEAALGWLPWSLFWVDGLVRLRRASLIARKRESPDTQALHQIASELRSRIDVALAKPRQALISRDWKKRLSDAIRQPQTIVWIVLVTPSLLWFVVSSVPGLAWTQTALSTRPAWTMIRLLALPALLWLAWQTVVALRAWSRVVREQLGDVAAAFTLRLVSGVGALSFGLYAFVVAATASGPTTRLIDNSHILDALGQGLALTGLLMALLSLLLFPPGALTVLLFGLLEGTAAAGQPQPRDLGDIDELAQEPRPFGHSAEQEQEPRDLGDVDRLAEDPRDLGDIDRLVEETRDLGDVDKWPSSTPKDPPLSLLWLIPIGAGGGAVLGALFWPIWGEGAILAGGIVGTTLGVGVALLDYFDTSTRTLHK